MGIHENGFNRDEGDTGDKNRKNGKKDNLRRSTSWIFDFVFLTILAPIPFIPLIPVRPAVHGIASA